MNSPRATQSRIWVINVLREYLLRGYSVNVRLSQLKDSMHRNFMVQDQRITTFEEKIDFFVRAKELSLQDVFYDGSCGMRGGWC